MGSPPRRLVAPRVCHSDHGRVPCPYCGVFDEFRKSRPGSRFQDHYRRKRTSRGGTAWRYTVMAGGAVLCLLGIFLLVVPGPGIPVLAAGAALLAQQSRATAQLLDRIELRLRRMLGR